MAFMIRAFAGRLKRLSPLLHNSSRKQSTRKQELRRGLSRLEMLQRIMANLPEPRDLFHRTLAECFASNPAIGRVVDERSR